MLMNQVKSREEILAAVQGKIFAVVCNGCKEVSLAEAEHQTEALLQELKDCGRLVGKMTVDYVCNPAYFHQRFDQYASQLEAADTILVFSCGVGVQTVASFLDGKRVCAACDTYPLPGFQGVTPLEHDCQQCGECYLNLTGGICPLTACSKSLVNGQCGGAKDGKCEVDPNMECGWERIYQKLKRLGRLDAMKCPVQVRNYATDSEV